MARIIGDLQRFQVAYNLLEVPEIQTYLSRCLEGLAHGGDATSLCQCGHYHPRAGALLYGG